MTVYDQGVMTDYATGISLIVQAMITSPSFIYRTELGPTTLAADASGNYPDTTLNPYEIASQLGFLFLGSLPDAALTAAAADGSLATTDGLNAQIDRLLALPAVKANLTNIIIDWFNVRQMFDKAQQGHGAALGAGGGRSRSDAMLTTDLYTVDAAVRERRAVDQRRDDERPGHVAEGLPEQAPRDAVSGRDVLGRRARQQHDVRRRHLARVAGARRASSPSRASSGRRPIRRRRRSSSAASSFTTTSSARTCCRRRST